MKKSFIIVAFALLSVVSYAQKKGNKEAEKPKAAYEFTDVKINDITGAKNQGSAGTCWSFGTMAAIESDVIKNGKGAHDLSEMWIVRNTYLNKIKKFVRMHGNSNLGQGGNAHDLLNVVAECGLVPEEVYPGLNYGTSAHVHGELDAALIAYTNAIVKNPNRTLSTAWVEGANGILDAYFGKRPEKFTYQGKEYTPKSFASELGVNTSDYVSITSFSHHPFYTAFAVEIPDNWAWGNSYNLPLNEFEEVLDGAINNGYTVSWGADVSEKGFAYNKGFAVLPETNVSAIGNLEKDRWVKLTPEEINAQMFSFEQAVPEVNVSQELRQKWFDNYQTADDHSMQLYGIAKDGAGNKFYKVKNSWGTNHLYNGSFYVSTPYFLGKTINFMVNKNALSADMRAKLGIK